MIADLADLSRYQLLGLTEDGQSGDLLRGMPERAARIRLQALISEWLRMENLVVLTDSGTSVYSGGNTMANLEKAVFATLKALPELPKALRSIIEVREFDTDVIGSAFGFEAWLSFVANAVVVGATPKSPFRLTSWKGGQDPTQAELIWFVE